MKAIKQLEFIFKNLDNLLVIHYSCQSLSDNNEGYSPRVTSIAVLHEKSRCMKSFSIHMYAEKEKIDRVDIDTNYDKLETLILEDYFEYVRNHHNAYWLHWNMTNINYGFEALAHRYEVLTGKRAPIIEDIKRFNLSTMILAVYGRDCVEHPRMRRLMELNGGIDRDYLEGKDEVEAFNNKEYLKLHKSTMHKAYWFSHMLHLLKMNKINTSHTNWKSRIERFCESTAAKVIGFAAGLATLGGMYFWFK